MRRFLKYAGFFCLGVILVLCVIVIQVQWNKDIMQTIDTVNPAPYAIVLGASVTKSGSPSDALRDRVMTGVDLYKQHKAEKLLMTGDDGEFHIDEVSVMKRLAREAGVPEEDILVDEHGYRTYESCKRANEVFQIEKAIIVTQRFHLARAIYLCTHFGIQSQGIIADRQSYSRIVYFWTRDLLSSVKAWWDVNIHPPQPSVKGI